MRRLSAVVGAVAVVVGLAGCGGEPDAEEAMAEVEAARVEVVGQLRDASAALVSAGFRVEGLGGSYGNCGGGGLNAKTAIFRGGGVVEGVEGGVNERIEKVTGVLVDAGWEVTDDRVYQGERSTRLSREGMALAVDPSQLITDEQIPVVGVSGDCVDVTTDQQADLLTGGREPISP